MKRAIRVAIFLVPLLPIALLFWPQRLAHGPPQAQANPAPLRRAVLPRDRPDVFIYLIDALRADHLGCYGYHRPTTPNLDAFAEDAVLFEAAQTTSTWTRPAVASLFTGHSPLRHQAMTHHDALPESALTLGQILRSQGYQSAALITNANVAPAFGLAQGFDDFSLKNCAPAVWTTEQVAAVLTSCGHPYFLYVHTIEPHSPYAPRPQARVLFDSGAVGKCDGSIHALRQVRRLWPDISAQDVNHLLDLYDAQVWEADRAFGDFLTLLRAAGRYDSALIIALADHGEAFAEHETLEHGNTLCVEELRIPLLIKFPHGRHAGEHISDLVTTLDLAPTILCEVGARPAVDMPGWDLGALLLGQGRPRPVFAYVCADNPEVRAVVAVIDADGYKRAIDVSRDHWIPKSALGLWDTKADPAEKQNLFLHNPARAAACRQLIDAWMAEERAAAEGTPSRIELAPETREQLKALGYLR